MPTLSASDKLTALEAVRRTSQPWPNRIIECLTQKNEILMDMPAVVCNHGTEHTFVRRAFKEGGFARKYYEGVDEVASQTVTVTEPTQIWEAYSNPDKDMCDDTGDPAGFRKSEAKAILDAMGDDQARDLIYGNRGLNNGKSINGLATRYNKLNKDNVFSMGGTGVNLTSVYLVAQGEQYAHLIYPSNAGTVGAQMKDLGEQTVKDKDSKPYQAYSTFFKCQYGLAVEDPRAVIRICNIDKNAANAGDLLIEQILNKLRRMPSGASTYSLYGNYTVMDLIDKSTYGKGNVIFPTTDPWGRPITMIRNLRVRVVEAILDTESAIA